MIRAITFDLWDTLIANDSDEPKRADLAMPTKYDKRRELVWQTLRDHGIYRPSASRLGAVTLARESRTERIRGELSTDFDPTTPEPARPAGILIARESVRVAYDALEAAFNHSWLQYQITWPLSEQVEVLLATVEADLPDDVKAKLIKELSRVELEVLPEVIRRQHDNVAALAERYVLGIVSDTINTPARSLRTLLDLVKFRSFSTFAFSDEVGRAKPHADMFLSALAALDVSPHESLHIGDREVNDVRGAKALGMKSILFVPPGKPNPAVSDADAICRDPDELLTVVDQLAR
ncbi:MAG: HAD family hydrolase [Pseudomonadota bacterium]